VARLDGLLQGQYQVSVDRALTPDEIARLPIEDRDATVFAGGLTVHVVPPASEGVVFLVAARRGSLVISEVFLHTAVPGLAETPTTYLEVFNNADTAVYLDGVLLFRSPGGLHSGGVETCAEMAPYRGDTNGIWALTIHRFPGDAGGRSLAVPPGAGRIVAQTAADHGVYGNGMPDLSLAQFEIIGVDSDPNNPFAHDMG
jgi:hypothetical protein